jgi:hypothetical protein
MPAIPSVLSLEWRVRCRALRFLPRIPGAEQWSFQLHREACRSSQGNWSDAERVEICLKLFLAEIVGFVESIKDLDKAVNSSCQATRHQVHFSTRGRLGGIVERESGCIGYLGRPFEKQTPWAIIASLFLSGRWNSAIDPVGESFSFTRENTGIWTANHQGRHTMAL